MTLLHIADHLGKVGYVIFMSSSCYVLMYLTFSLSMKLLVIKKFICSEGHFQQNHEEDLWNEMQGSLSDLNSEKTQSLQ